MMGCEKEREGRGRGGMVCPGLEKASIEAR